MASLNILSLISGTAAQTQGGANSAAKGAALQEGVAPEFAPVLDQQLQGQEGAKGAGVAPAPGLLAAFLQRLSVVVSEDAAQAAANSNADPQGEKIQALVGQLMALLQQQGHNLFGQNSAGQEMPGDAAGGASALSVESLLQLQPEQIESLSNILGVSTEEIELALQQLVKEQMAAASTKIIPVSPKGKDDFDITLQEEKTADRQVSETSSSAAVVVPVQIPLAVPVAVQPKFEITLPLAAAKDEQEDTSFTEVDATGVLVAPALVAIPEAVNAGEGVVQPQPSAAPMLTAPSLLPVTAEGNAQAEPGMENPQEVAEVTQSAFIPVALPGDFTLKNDGTTAQPEIITAQATALAKTKVDAQEKDGAIVSETPVASAQPTVIGVKPLPHGANALSKELSGAARRTSTNKVDIDVDGDADKGSGFKTNATGLPDAPAAEIADQESLMKSEHEASLSSEAAHDYVSLRDIAAPAARKLADAPQRNSPLLPMVPVAEQVWVKIKDLSSHNGKQIEIHLDPKDLGKVDVRMDVDNNGRTQITMTVDKRETLEMLQRDRVSLERALNEMGLKADSGSMNFNLREQPRGQQQLADQQMQQQGRGWKGEPLPEELREDIQPTQPYRGGYILTLDEGVNISV